MNTRLLFVHALSPLHAGTGQSFGAIDLAIARDRATDHPYLPGSGLKGGLRAVAFAAAGQDPASRDKAIALFGPDTANADLHAGSLAFGDANLLLLPVRSVRGTFAWVTSPLLLARFLRDAREVGGTALPQAPPSEPPPDKCHLAPDSALKDGNGKVYFEDLDFAESGTEVDEWATSLARLLFAGDAFWQAHLRSHFCVVHDDVMTFLCRYGTDVVTRNVLEVDTKTAANLWDEENLPAETVLYGLTLATPNRGAQAKWGGAMAPAAMFSHLGGYLAGPIQFGGKATVGRGRCRLVLSGGAG